MRSSLLALPTLIPKGRTPGRNDRILFPPYKMARVCRGMIIVLLALTSVVLVLCCAFYRGWEVEQTNLTYEGHKYSVDLFVGLLKYEILVRSLEVQGVQVDETISWSDAKKNARDEGNDTFANFLGKYQSAGTIAFVLSWIAAVLLCTSIVVSILGMCEIKCFRWWFGLPSLFLAGCATLLAAIFWVVKRPSEKWKTVLDGQNIELDRKLWWTFAVMLVVGFLCLVLAPVLGRFRLNPRGPLSETDDVEMHVSQARSLKTTRGGGGVVHERLREEE